MAMPAVGMEVMATPGTPGEPTASDAVRGAAVDTDAPERMSPGIPGPMTSPLSGSVSVVRMIVLWRHC